MQDIQRDLEPSPAPCFTLKPQCSTPDDYRRNWLRGYGLQRKMDTQSSCDVTCFCADASRTSATGNRLARKEGAWNFLLAETARARRTPRSLAAARSDHGCKPNMRTIISMTGVDAVNVSFQVHILRTKSVISIPVMDKMTTIARRLRTFQIEYGRS